MADTRIRAGAGALPAWARLPLAIASGAILGLGQAPWDLPWLALAGLVGAVAMFASARSLKGALGAGWGVGLGYFGLVLGWVIEPFQVDAATTGWMAPFALFFLAAGLALFWGVAFWGAAHASLRRRLFALAVCWAAAEFARSYVFTGFSWALVGAFWLETPAIQWSAVIGPHGLNVVTVGLGALIVGALRARRPLVPGLAAVVLLGALIGGGMALTPPLQDLTGRPVVRLVQPNAAQHEKWDRAHMQRFFDRQVEFTAEPAQNGLSRPALIVWPETAVPTLLNNADELLGVVTDAALPAKVALGIQREDDGRYYNSLVIAGLGPRIEAIYDKHHLVPFGEYMPAPGLFRHIGIGGLAQRAASGYAAGPGPRMVDLGGDIGLALPLICYEAVFPQDTRVAPLRPALLLQVTNDAWFGSFSGPYQHLAQARMRAIEQGLPLVRAANTGVSAVIDGAGRVLDSLPLGEAGFLDGPLPPPSRVTPYSRVGDLPALAGLFLLGLAAFLRRRCVSY
ncbi:acyltransferase [Salipiger aestuarii]|uniref:apolipoprotein N-acyltransferase n=1 Tax=Salipiger aestuarii TaxID=568098 RepID=UPI001238A03A|nr:apolipoprotein N-acyltransferase [Salipiger aestuarii]KAA8609743.1 acyltransferase [Salipiger aestuarii]